MTRKKSSVQSASQNMPEKGRANTALQELEDQLRLITDNLPLMFSYLDTNLRFQFVNKTYEKWYAVTREKICGKYIEDVVDKDVYLSLKSNLKKALAGTIVSYENLIDYPDGNTRYVKSTVFPYFGSNGVVKGLFATASDLSDRKKKEDDALQNREQFSAIFDHVQAGIFIVDDTTHEILDANTAAIRMIGYPKENIIGKVCHKFIYPEESGACPVTEPGQIIDNSEAILIDVTGNRIPILKTAKPMMIGERRYLLESFIEITDQKQAGKLLHFQRDLGIALGSASDLNATLVKVLQSCRQIQGVDAGGFYLINNKTGDLELKVHDGLPDSFLDTISRFLMEKQPALFSPDSMPLFLNTRNTTAVLGKEIFEGGIRSLAVLPIFYKREVVGVLILLSRTVEKMSQRAIDSLAFVSTMIERVFERVKAQEVILQSETLLKSTFRAAPVVIGCMNKECVIIWINAKISAMTGYNDNELVGKSTRLLYVSDEAYGTTVQILFAQMEQSGTGSVETQWKGKDGTVIDIVLSATPVNCNDFGEGIIIAALDITQRKRLEEQLRQTEKMQAIGQLAGGIAHDFNNQLSSIMGYADLIQEAVRDNPTLSRYAENILISTRHAADLTSQMLAFARKGKYLSVPINVHTLILEIVSLLQHSIDKKIKIKNRLNANPPLTIGDPAQLQSALLNLAVNAGDAMEKGGNLLFCTDIVKLDEEFCSHHVHPLKPGNYIEIQIVDTGTGIEPSILKHIFEPFFTTKELGKGIGMGLAAVYGTASNHGGAIGVKTEVGKGSTFSLYLPLLEESIQTGKSHYDKKNPGSRGTVQILLVDDEELIRDLGYDMLTSMGYTVTVCANGREAVTLYKNRFQDFGLVILDMIMPEMDGRETYLKMLQINPDLKVILSTGYALDGNAKAMMECGVKGFLQKPFRKVELSQKVAEVLET